MTTERTSRGLSRRTFLGRVAALGGAAALGETLALLGTAAPATAWEPPAVRPVPDGEATSVVILGAGIGGLTAAYLLTQYGYRVKILEATSRAGGRNRTVRRGDVITERVGDQLTHQECRFDSGLWLNAGAGRLPYHHRRVLRYCQELEVKLEPYVFNTTGNLFQTSKPFNGNRPVAYRRIQADARGRIAELVATGIKDGTIDPGVDAQVLLRLLTRFGSLQADGSYLGTTRGGCDDLGDPTLPSPLGECDTNPPYTLQQLLDSEFWDAGFYDTEEFEWQPTLFHPSGGMDMIVEGFLRKVGHLIEYDAPVTGITNAPDRVTVRYRSGADEAQISADHCISNIPGHLLDEIIGPGDGFSPAFLDATAAVRFAASCKVGWQANTRFWEQSPTDIYGGISWTDDLIEQIWYPSTDYFTQKGTLTGAYIHDGDLSTPEGPSQTNATRFGTWDVAKRLQVARAGAVKLHPEFADDSIVPQALGLTIAWQNVPYMHGAWPYWNDRRIPQATRDAQYRAYLRGDGRFSVAGDQTSTLPGWQEGAMASAEHCVRLVMEGDAYRDTIGDDVLAPTTFAPGTVLV